MKSPKNNDLQKAIPALEGSTGELAVEDHNPGRGLYRRQLERFSKLEDKAKHEELRQAWKDVAMGAAQRAKQFVATCSSKDFGRLYQVIMSGAVAIDKAFPPKEQHNAPAFVVNMFGSLGQRAAAIAMPAVPIIDATEVKECPDSETKTVPSLPIPTETLATTKPSPSLLTTP